MNKKGGNTGQALQTINIRKIITTKQQNKIKWTRGDNTGQALQTINIRKMITTKQQNKIK